MCVCFISWMQKQPHTATMHAWVLEYHGGEHERRADNMNGPSRGPWVVSKGGVPLRRVRLLE